MIQEPFAILAVLLGVLAGLFLLNTYPVGKRIFTYVPLLVFCYFVPTVLSNLGLIPLESPLYTIIKKWLLPASLVLLTLSVDIPAILGLGRKVLILFLAATATIVVGGPLAYLALGWMAPEAMGDQVWKGLAALSGSWIGGGANFIAIGESVGANESTISMMVIVDVAVANVWMAYLLFCAGKDKQLDKKIGADRKSLNELKAKTESYLKEVATVAQLKDLLLILFIAFGAVAIATALAAFLPDIGKIVRGFTWVVIIVTTIGVALSYSPLRRLEGAGASKIGSVFLYLLVASIGARAEFAKVIDAPALVLIGFLWIAIHGAVLLLLRRWIKAPIFYMAVGSQANIGGAASAPIVASAFHPTLAPVGVMLAVGGYVLGTYAGLLCAFLLELVSRIY